MKYNLHIILHIILTSFLISNTTTITGIIVDENEKPIPGVNIYSENNGTTTDENGIFLLHTIGSSEGISSTNPWIRKYIFPGGIVPSLSDMAKPIEKTGLILSDCETLIHHYDKTLKAWLDRFMQNKQKAKYMYNKEFVRMWEFYLASCSAAFKFRDLVVYQLQLVKNFTALPSNRRNYIYR